MNISFRSGFTLVELAIVMTIIGLLIGGVLKGQQLLQNAKVTRQVKQFESVNTAALMFMDQYAAMPGDMGNATARIQGCTAANFCGNGDGDSIIGTHTVGFHTSQYKLASLPAAETAYFWKHLAMANLISGVVPNANPALGVWGESYPAAVIDGGLLVGYNSEYYGTPNTAETGHFLMITEDGTNRAGAPVLTVMMLDQKLDDGKPNTGGILAEHVGTGCKDDDVPTGIYTPTSPANSCVMWYKTNF